MCIGSDNILFKHSINPQRCGRYLAATAAQGRST